MKKHKPEDCPYLHVKNCPGCGRSCSCHRKEKPLDPSIRLQCFVESILASLIRLLACAEDPVDKKEIRKSIKKARDFLRRFRSLSKGGDA